MVLDFDPDDWIDPDVAALNHGALEVDVTRHGDGDDQNMVNESLNADQAEAVLEQSARFRSLNQAQDIFKELGGALGGLSDGYCESRHAY